MKVVCTLEGAFVAQWPGTGRSLDEPGHRYIESESRLVQSKHVGGSSLELHVRPLQFDECSCSGVAGVPLARVGRVLMR